MPTGGQVMAGQATISRSGTRTQITQGSDRAVVDWQGFDVGRNASVNFTQPNAASWTLNRVNTPDPSMIAGRITANGGVAIVNPSGVVFSQGSQVNVGSLIATTSNITNQNFMAGQMTFDGRGNPGARVENHGSITVAQRGLAALVAPGVANRGTIRARLGTAILAGAETFHLDLAGDGLVSIDVTEAVRQAPGGRAALVTNSGLVEAHGGQVILTANAASALVEDVVLNTGQLRANAAGDSAGRVTVSVTGGNANIASGRVTARGGTVEVTARDAAVTVGPQARISASSRSGGGSVQLGGADTAAVTVQGRVAARGAGAAATGGRVAIQARDRVTLTSTARVDASGGAGGGTVLVGTTGLGRAQAMARTTEVNAGATVRADAVTRGQGGTVVVNSADSTVMMGQVSVRGGGLTGNGGFVEISGLNGLRLNLPGVDVRAPAGRGGTLLIDPTAIVIAAGGSDPVDNTPPVAGTATLAPADIKTFLEGSGSLLLQATQSITVNDAVTASSAARTLTLETTTGGGTGITFNAALNLTGIGLVLNSGSSITSAAAGTISAAGITMTAPGTVTLAGAANAGTGALVINADGAISGTGALSAASLTVRGAAGGTTRAASLDLTGGNAIASLDARTSGALTFQQAGALTVTQADAGAAAVSLGSDGAITGGVVVGASLTVRGAAGGTTRAASLELMTGNAITSLDALTSGALTFRQIGALTVAQADAGAATVSLGSDGAITGGGVLGSLLTVRGSAGGTTRGASLELLTGNAITSLDALTIGALTFQQVGALTITQADAGVAAVTLGSDGAITGGGVLGSSLTVRGAAGGTTRAASLELISGNSITSLDALTSGALAFQQAGALTITQADAGISGVTLGSDGAITGGGVLGSSLTVRGAAGGITRAASLALTTGNAITSLDALTSGALTFQQAGALTVTQADAGATAVYLGSDGAITGGGALGSSLTVRGAAAGTTRAASLELLTGNTITSLDALTTGALTFQQAGTLTITQADAGASAITLGSDGAITGGGVLGSSLTVRGAAGGTTRAASLELLAGNTITSLDALTSGTLTFRQVGALTVMQASAGASAITLGSDGAITGGTVAGSSLTVRGSTGGATRAASLALTAGNAIASLDARTSGALTFQQAGALTVTQADAGVAAVILGSDGAITGGGVVGASLTAGGFTGAAAQSLTLLTGNAVTGALDIRTAGDIAFGQVGALQLARADAGTGTITLRSDGAVSGSNLLGSGLTVEGFSGERSGGVDLSTGNSVTGAVSLRAGGNLTFAQSGDILLTRADAGTDAVTLRSNGSVTGTGVVGASLTVAGTTNTAAASVDLGGNAVTGSVDLQASGDIGFAQLGDISLARAASGGLVTLRSDGTVGGSNISGSGLTVEGFTSTRAGGISLSTGNAVTGAVSLQTVGNLTFAQDGNILLTRADAGTGAVTLRSNGSMTGTSVAGASLSVAGTTNTAAASIDLSGNAVTGSIDLRASGAIGFAQAGGLTLARAASGAAVTMRSDGDVQGSNISGTFLTVAGATGARAGAVTLVTGNAISGAIDILASGSTSFIQSGALSLARVDAGTGAVTLRSDGAISGTGVAGSSLSIAGASLAATSVDLTSNAVTGAVDIRALGGISFSQAGNLSVTRAASTLNGAITLASDGAITGGGALGGSLTVRGATGARAGSLNLTTGNAVSGTLDIMTSGALSFYQAASLLVGRADAGTGAVNLRSDGNITGSGVAGSSLAARGFGGGRADLINLSGNAVTGDVSLTGTGSIAYAQAGGFNVVRADPGLLGTVTLRSDGIITGGGVTATTLTVGGSSTLRAGGLDLSGSGNAVGLLSALTSGDLGFSQSGALLVAPGSGSSAGNVSLTSLTGAIGLNASLAAGNGKTLSLTSDSITLSESLIALGGTVQLRRATPGDIVIGSTGGDTTLPPGSLATIVTADRLIITTTGAITVASSIVAPVALELAGSTGVTINSGITISSLSPGLIVDASTGSLTNNGTIRGSALAAGTLRNAGRIDGDATSTLLLTNLSGATIGGSATSTAGALTNAGTITGSASSAGLLTNSSGARIGGDAASTGGAVSNAATIVGRADAATDITNSGSIGGTAIAGEALTNQLGASIGGSATTTAGALANFGTITGGATAGTTLTNSNRIGLAALAGGLLTNSGRVLGNATSTGGGLTNSGTIDGAALAAGALQNSGGIGGGATSSGLLTNLLGGTITGDASSTAGALQNGGRITGAATSGGDLTNGGTIGGAATSSAALTNTGGIGAEARAVGDLANRAGATIGGPAISSTGAVDNAGRITGAVTAATTLDNGGFIGDGAIATGQLTNRTLATITGGATSLASAIVNDGGIGGAALAATTLTSSGSIGLTAEAAGLLTNSGSIGGTATSTGAGLVNTGTIDGIATALTSLTNSGRIGGDALAGGLLTNQIGGDIRGEAVSSGGSIDNSAGIRGLASAATTLSNTGSIGGDATAGGLLTNGAGAIITGLARSTTDAIGNSGSIGLSATAATALTNTGSIGGDALAGALLTNGPAAIITGLARSTGGAIENSGRIGLSATAATTLTNSDRIGGDALAAGLLTNTTAGTILGLVSSTGGAISNEGSIGLTASAATTLTNSGRIGGDALAGGLLTNAAGAVITGIARSTGGAIGNAGTIGLSATAAATLTNTGSIGGDALAARLLTNGPGASITGLATSTGEAISNTGSIGRTATAAAALTNTGSIGGDALAGGLLTNGPAATITGLARSTGDAIVNSGGIGLTATAATTLTNSGRIGGNATAAGLLQNLAGGVIGGSAVSTAASLGNGGRIGAGAQAQLDLSNQAGGAILGSAASLAGALANAGAIGGSATASGTLTNSGSIGLAALSGGTLTNSGTIGLAATAMGGALTNTGSIGLTATAAGPITNAGGIGADAMSGASILNSGRIGGTVTAEGSVSNLAGAVINGGAILARTGSFTSQGRIDTAGALLITAARDILLNGPTLAGGTMTLNTSGAIQGTGSLAASSLSVRGTGGGGSRATSLDLSAAGSQVGAIDILVDGPLRFGQGLGFHIITADAGSGPVSFNTDGAIVGTGSVIGRGLTVAGFSGPAALSLELTQAANTVGELDAQLLGSLTFRDTGPLLLRRATSATEAVSITAGGDLTVLGPVVAGSDLALRSQGGSILAQAGSNLGAGRDATLDAPVDVILSGSGLSVARTLYVTAGRDALKTDSSISTGNLGDAGRGVSAGRDFLWSSGSLAAANIYDVQAGGALGLNVTTGSVALRGRIQASGDLGIRVAAGSLDLAAVSMTAGGNLLLSATQGVSALASTLSAGGTAGVTAAAGNVAFAGSTLRSNGALSIRSARSFSASDGSFSTSDALTVEAGGSGRIQRVTMSASTALAGGVSAFRPLRISVGGALDYTQNQITGDRIELVSGGHLTTAGSVFRAGTGLLLSARGGIGDAGEAATQVQALSADRLPLVILDTRSGIFLSRLPDLLTPATADSPARNFDDQPWQLVGARRGELFFGIDDGAPAAPSNAAAGNVALNLTAPGEPVFLLLNGGTATGRLEAGRLGIFGVPGDQLPSGRAVDLTGTLNDFDGVSAARFGGVSALALGVPPTGAQFYRFNNCTLTSVNCVTPVIFRIPIIPVVNNVVLNNELGTVDDPDVMLTNVADQDY
ncbi:beta strand repeat-containing protein [Roseococcus sp.]|uniref:beta strand repeat-containing protein n=1 Tax=Roseococcus sp. TaxID=2109646 RepID=UPI003BA9B3D1